MTALARLFRTTAFKLMAVFLVVFSVFAAGLIATFAWNTDRLIRAQIIEAIDAETASLVDSYKVGGIRLLTFAMERRAQRPDSLLYLVTNFQGEALAGNVSELPGDVLARPGWHEARYGRLDETTGPDPEALVRVEILPGGFRLLVGRDLAERRRLQSILINGALGSLALVLVMGVAGGWFVARRVLGRLDDITRTSRSIIEGDLSRRLAIAGTGDEIDRLAATTNAMLDRIGELMVGLTEVSDNIAHDLKTPLTRLRNRVEAALRAGGSEEDYRRALEATIEESDGLIRTFNALLMIARAESGHLQSSMAGFDMADVARGVAELYEPVAEEAGGSLTVHAPATLMLWGHRDLIGQALSNLVDNALKHGGAGPVEIVVEETGGLVRLIVADRGPGIAEADRGRVLERFVRLETSRSRPGSGLGLSLAAAVARLHSGQVRLEDHAPGLRAVIELPKRAGP